jgi:hypothetical protein
MVQKPTPSGLRKKLLKDMLLPSLKIIECFSSFNYLGNRIMGNSFIIKVKRRRLRERDGWSLRSSSLSNEMLSEMEI